MRSLEKWSNPNAVFSSASSTHATPYSPINFASGILFIAIMTAVLCWTIQSGCKQPVLSQPCNYTIAISSQKCCSLTILRSAVIKKTRSRSRSISRKHKNRDRESKTATETATICSRFLQSLFRGFAVAVAVLFCNIVKPRTATKTAANH